DRIARAGIHLAVDIVDKISDEALLGLTVAHAVSTFLPVAGDAHRGLDVLNDLFGKVFYGTLPKGQEWLDHLDILNTVRLSTFGQLKKIQQFYPEVLSGYVDTGIENGSENHNRAMEIFKKNNLPQDLLVEHCFNSSFLRLPVSDRQQIDTLTLQQQLIHQGQMILVPVKLSPEHVNAIKSVYDLYSNDESQKQKNIESFMAEWDKRPNLKVLKDWWDDIPMILNITSAGKVLAHSNAQRCDNRLPPMS
ncbi:hypothetical protein AB6C72_26120, partial [Vibrio splendidus]